MTIIQCHLSSNDLNEAYRQIALAFHRHLLARSSGKNLPAPIELINIPPEPAGQLSFMLNSLKLLSGCITLEINIPSSIHVDMNAIRNHTNKYSFITIKENRHTSNAIPLPQPTPPVTFLPWHLLLLQHIVVGNEQYKTALAETEIREGREQAQANELLDAIATDEEDMLEKLRDPQKPFTAQDLNFFEQCKFVCLFDLFYTICNTNKVAIGQALVKGIVAIAQKQDPDSSDPIWQARQLSIRTSEVTLLLRNNRYSQAQENCKTLLPKIREFFGQKHPHALLLENALIGATQGIINTIQDDSHYPKLLKELLEIYFELNQLKAAKEYFQLSLKVHKETNTTLRDHPNVAIIQGYLEQIDERLNPKPSGSTGPAFNNANLPGLANHNTTNSGNNPAGNSGVGNEPPPKRQRKR